MKVLFIGNSYTLYNDVPAQVQRLARDAGLPMEVVMQAEGGATLEAHEARPTTQEALASGGYSHVVLQEQSTRPLHDRALFLRSLSRLASKAVGAGDCQLLLYQTWPRKAGHAVYRSGWSGRTPQRMLDGLAEAYGQARDELTQQGMDVAVAGVGASWVRSLSRHPSLELYDTDGHHASPAGSHLAALTITAALTSAQQVTPTCYIPGDLDSRAGTQLRLSLLA